MKYQELELSDDKHEAWVITRWDDGTVDFDVWDKDNALRFNLRLTQQKSLELRKFLTKRSSR